MWRRDRWSDPPTTRGSSSSGPQREWRPASGGPGRPAPPAEPPPPPARVGPRTPDSTPPRRPPADERSGDRGCPSRYRDHARRQIRMRPARDRGDQDHGKSSAHGGDASSGTNSDRWRSRPVSRILCPALRPAATISLSGRDVTRAPSRPLRGPRSLLRPTRELGRAVLLRPRGRNAPCLALLRVGFAEPDRSPGPLVSSYLTVSPLPPGEPGGGLFSVALSAGRPAWALPSTLPCGVRTFLDPMPRAAAARPAPPCS